MPLTQIGIEVLSNQVEETFRVGSSGFVAQDPDLKVSDTENRRNFNAFNRANTFLLPAFLE